jgi:LmbE family N-acetylglucosaminyl deacetylase
MSHNNNVVIISAHPDDMEIGMGATVAKLVESITVITSVAEQTVVGLRPLRVHGTADGRIEKRGGSPCRWRLGSKRRDLL